MVCVPCDTSSAFVVCFFAQGITTALGQTCTRTPRETSSSSWIRRSEGDLSVFILMPEFVFRAVKKNRANSKDLDRGKRDTIDAHTPFTHKFTAIRTPFCRQLFQRIFSAGSSVSAEGRYKYS